MRTNDRLTARAREIAEEERAAFRDAFFETNSMEAAVERVREIRSRRGGARPGAGRPVGSGTGRKNTARLQFDVSPELRDEFERRAAAEGVSKVELLRRLLAK